MTDVGTLTLNDFLLARIAEDETVARRASWFLVDFNGAMNGQFGDRFNPARVLAECEAKRRIVEDFIDARSRVVAGDRDYLPRRNVLFSALTALALPYAAHADYREDWLTYSEKSDV